MAPKRRRGKGAAKAAEGGGGKTAEEEMPKASNRGKRVKAPESPKPEPEYFPEKRNLEDLWQAAFPVGTEWDNMDKIREINWNFSNLENAFEEGGELYGKKVYMFGCTEPQLLVFNGEQKVILIPVVVAVVSPIPPSDKIGLKSIQRETEDILPMKAMKMAWVPYVPLEDRQSQVDRLKSQIFTLSCTQRSFYCMHPCAALFLESNVNEANCHLIQSENDVRGDLLFKFQRFTVPSYINGVDFMNLGEDHIELCIRLLISLSQATQRDIDEPPITISSLEKSALKLLKEERVKQYDYCLPYLQPLKPDEDEEDTVVNIMFPLEPPVVCDFDWVLDELEEFTNELIKEEVLPEDQKDSFKAYVKEQVRERKKTQKEAKEARRKAIEDMDEATKTAFENMRFYKFYPTPTLDTPDISSVKVSYINRYYGKAHVVV